ncbi:MAG: hypothetical protein ACLGHN_12810 [Bacteriovoracia bacterium]
MFPEFFQNKVKEVRGFLKIMKGKLKSDDRERLRGVEDSLKNLERERHIYEDERLKALNGIDPDTKRYQEEQPDEKVLKQSGGQDISAI